MENSKDIEVRLKTIEGHIRAVRGMVEQDKNCIDVITQLMAIEKSVKKASVIVLKNHLNHCVKNAVAAGKSEDAQKTLDQFNKILEMYL